MDHLKEANRTLNLKPALTVLEVKIIILGSLHSGDFEIAFSGSLSAKNGKFSWFID